MGLTKTDFILADVVFLFFVIQISALAGVSILNSTGITFTPPAPPTDPITFLLYIFNNIGIFFTLMGLSSQFFLIGAVLIVPLSIALLWAVIELIRGI